MRSLPAKIPIALAFAANIGLTLYGFAVLLGSPYTGIRLDVCGDSACVGRVDRESPVYQKIEPGDRLSEIDGLITPYFNFSSDPDLIASRSDQRTFWQFQRKIETVVVKDRPATYRFSRNGLPMEFSISPVSFPFKRAMARTLPQYVVGWTFLAVAYLVLRKKRNEISIANFIIGAFACAAFITLAPYSARDMSLPNGPFKILSVMNYIASQTFCYSLLHIVLVFPRKKAFLERHPRAISIPYILLGLVMTAHFAGLFENTHLTTYMSMNVCLLATLGMFVIDFFRERHPVYRRQIQWVVIGSLAGISSWLLMTSLPVVFGFPHLSQEISILPTVIYPLSFAFAVTRYRLMEIDNILDTAVVYGFTIFILAGIETAFLSIASPYVLATGKGLPYFSVIAVLLIVFIYVPVRNLIKGLVERMFRRGRYDPEREIQQLMVRLGLCDERSALEKFSAFVKDLLRPSGIIILKIGGNEAHVLHSEGGRALGEGRVTLSGAGSVWQYIRERGGCVFGYELAEKGIFSGTSALPDLENALFVPFYTEAGSESGGHLAVLLKKWNATAYSMKDVALLNAISVNIANIIEAGELRRERAEIETRHRREKETVMKELHDGLGNILTSITVTSQAAERMFESDGIRAKELVGRIEEYSSEAIQFMRTGLTVMDNPNGDMAEILEAMKDRSGEVFAAHGLDLQLDVSEGARGIRAGARVTMNLTRVIQEALNNVLKHSGAGKASITLDRTGNQLNVTVTDDGRGFDPAGEKKGAGLRNIANRVREMRGSFEIVSEPGRGARIALTIPLRSGKI